MEKEHVEKRRLKSDSCEREFFLTKEDETLSVDHEAILLQSKKLMYQVLYASFSYAFTYSLRSSIIVLYAKTFYDNTLVIGVFVYLSYFISGLMSLLFGYIGDHWRLDHLFFIVAALDIITFFLEATAQSFMQLAIAYAIGGQPFAAIDQSCFLKTLPKYYAQQFQARHVFYS